ncbi:hypothetical protein GCM10008959_19830 [Deinococcus seoulensis]|uniref:EAL domain-containing protein n=1 Tax=Deinococcus seoulensis TaxID=1837379 RepID=A0ABQ2RRC8_9DEIO|nr:EAL domain-containing protein [Deinococcus seoulensis]GGR58114.1 hypothetical protein GCM10008959_19830 [Deinococcus seoulensis]
MTGPLRRRWWWTGPDGPGQSLRVQVALLLAALILPTLLMVLTVIPGVIVQRFAQIERDQVSQYTRIAQEDLNTEERRVGLFVLNFSQWTETFEFAAGRNATFPAQVMVPSTFTGGRVDYAGIMSPQGTLMAAAAMQGDAVVDAEALVSTLMGTLPRTLPPDGVSGTVQVAGRPYLLAARTITRDDGSGSGGVMLFARALNAQALGALMHAEKTFTARLGALPTAGQEALTFAPGVVTVASPLSAPDGPPQLALQLSIPRDMYRAGQATVLQLKVVAVLITLERPFALREGEVTLKLVAGFSQSAYPVPFTALLRQAFLALQHAMDRNEHLGVFNEDMLRRSQYGHTLETQLQGAVSRQELSLMYQPISDVLTGQWVSLEALMRWQHPQLGVVPPGTFIPVAERSGQIYQLGEWALQTAAREIEQARALWPGAHVNVNVSPLQLLMPDFAERALGTLAALNVPPTLLTFEVTESTVMQNVELACRHLARLREAGVRIALDDFGSGHSSLSLLTELPLDVVKLDRSFLRDGVQDTARGALLRNTIRLARDLNLTTVAEGVEDAGMLARLRELGCDYAQGYHISRPDYLEDLLSLRT